MGFALYIALSFVALYLINNYFLSYWKRRNFPQADPTFFVGNCGKLLKLDTSFSEFLATFYDRSKKVVGIYLSYQPALIVNDPVITQQILIKDFNNFHDRPMSVNEDIDPLSGNLFFIKGKKWRELRVKFTPLFTSGKLKVMFPIMRDCGNNLLNYLSKNVENGNNVMDFKDLMSRFTINMISSVAFGIEIDCISEKDHLFRKMGLSIFTGSIRRALSNFFILFWPDLMEKMKIPFATKEMEDFFFSIVNQTVEHREKNNIKRNDFMDLMIQLKNFGYLTADKTVDNEMVSDTKTFTKLSMNEVAAQAFVFFAAGFETSSSTTSFCLFELCRNQEIQRKVQKEIDDAFTSAGSEGLTYESLQEMKYLDMCIDETLRKYPVVFVSRVAANDFKIPTTDLVVEKGTTIFFPLLGFQRDPEIYDNPLEFRPERFLNSSTGNAKIDKGICYMPFGDGPRNCIGARMGKIQAKLGVVLALREYNLELNDEKMQNRELKFDIKAGILNAREQLNFKIHPRKKNI